MKKALIIFLLGLISNLTFSQIVQNKPEVYLKMKGNNYKNNLPFKDCDGLIINNYASDTFPTDDVLKYENLEFLKIESPSLATKIFDLNKVILPKLIFDFTKLKKLKKLKRLNIEGFSLNTIPVELSELVTLRYLSIGYSFLDSITEDISKFNILNNLIYP